VDREFVDLVEEMMKKVLQEWNMHCMDKNYQL
jgi:hypothetical protein